MANITIPFNNYARVTGISADGMTITYDNKTTNGMAPIGAGALIMFHVSKHSDSSDMSLLGKFMLANVLSDSGASLTLDMPVTMVFDPNKLSKYSCQIISIAQFGNLTINYDYSGTLAWDDSRKVGGICAIACKGALDIRDGQINVENKGGGTSYGATGLAFIGNSQMYDILPLGNGHGSVFLLSKSMITNSTSRIGATHSGQGLGGKGGNSAGKGGGIAGGYASGGSTYDYVRSPGATIAYYEANNIYGRTYAVGSHLFLVCDNISDFSLQYISTGGTCKGTPGYNCSAGEPGGAGYGAGAVGAYGTSYSAGAGGCYAVGGGSYAGLAFNSGWAFIHANSVTSKDTIGVIAV